LTQINSARQALGDADDLISDLLSALELSEQSLAQAKLRLAELERFITDLAVDGCGCGRCVIVNEVASIIDAARQHGESKHRASTHFELIQRAESAEAAAAKAREDAERLRKERNRALQACCAGNTDDTDPVRCQSYEASEQSEPCPRGNCVMAEHDAAIESLRGGKDREGEG